MSDPAPIIVTALLGDEDFAWLDGLRRSHFPPERNFVPAHITLFHHLPPSLAGELKHRLNEATRDIGPPAARLSKVMLLGKGVAFRVESPELAAIRDELADAFAGMLTPQDRQSWHGHVTVQNKVESETAKALHAELQSGFTPRPVTITGLASWYYRNGPWEPLSRHKFRR